MDKTVRLKLIGLDAHYTLSNLYAPGEPQIVEANELIDPGIDIRLGDGVAIFSLSAV